MAKWGEGDPRWIVEERSDGVNVNNWHWVEKNATPWSKTRLPQLLTGKTIDAGPIRIELVSLKKIEGEATANNRKAKLIFLFEWELEIEFKANVAGDDLTYEGTLEIPNLSDENEADEVDVVGHLKTKGPHEAEIRRVLAHDVQSSVRKLVAEYIRDLKQEFSKGLILPTDKAKPQVITKGKTTVVDKQSFQNHVIESSKPAPTTAPAGPVEVKSFDTVDVFKVPPERLFEILTDPQLFRAWTNGSGVIDAKEGGKFSLLGGQITGSFESIKPNESLVMLWRLKKYPSEHFARVSFGLRDANDCTEFSISATGVPAEFLEETQAGFQRYYTQSIGRTFGCGLNLF